jgi:two-component system phosphate regulon sensor histidine kinase PhoR
MTLARRLLAGAMVVVTALTAAVVLLAGSRLRDRLVTEKIDELTRDAKAISALWHPGVNADSLASSMGDGFGYRVTLIDSTGVVQGDADFGPEARRRLENHATRPEVVAARKEGVGSSRRVSASAGDEELYVAVRHALGTVRVSISTRRLDDVVYGAQRDVLLSGLVALAGVFVLTWFFAHTISQPVIELGEVARAIADGDLSRRPPLSAPGEIGDLATALHRMAEQLANRLRALQEDDHLMVALLESLEEGVLALDQNGTVVRINERARALFNVHVPVPFGREALPRELTIRNAIDHALAGESTAVPDAMLGDRTVAITSRPLQPAGAVVTVLDLTMVRRLETVRRDFVANVSHELKTPLTAVGGFAETLLDDDIPADQRRRFAETIRDNALRMQHIVDDLLDLSRIESGGWRPNVADVELPPIVAAGFADVADRAASRRLELVSDIAPDAQHVHFDATALRQVVANLVQNAVQYTQQGSVIVRARRVEQGIRMEVADTGVGIPAEHLPRIFERFYRVDAGRSREQGGTGLGLAIVRHLVEAHGGRVEATSTPGIGTSISVLLPDATSLRPPLRRDA